MIDFLSRWSKPKPIAFNDIKIGDKVRRTTVVKQTETVEGSYSVVVTSEYTFVVAERFTQPEAYLRAKGIYGPNFYNEDGSKWVLLSRPRART